MICVDATTFAKLVTTSRQLFGTELIVTGSQPTAMKLHLLNNCVTWGNCQAVDPQLQTFLTNVSGVSATDAHAPTYISAVC